MALLAIISYYILSIYRVPTNLVRGFAQHRTGSVNFIDEVELLKIENSLPPVRYPGRETLIVPYALVRYINSRNFVSPDFFEMVDERKIPNIFEFVIGAIIPKNTLVPAIKDNIELNNLCAWFDTDHYDIFWRCDLIQKD